MTASVAHLLEEALLLPDESRAELVEAILESSAPSGEFVAEQMETVLRRMENVRNGSVQLIPAEEALRKAREVLATHL